MTHAALYARYSSEGQREASIEDQYRNCERYAEREGWQIVERYYDKGISGTKDENGRPGYKDMLNDAKAKRFAVVLVDDLSRLSRDMVECEKTRRLLVFLGIRLLGVSDGIDTASKGHKALSGFKGIMNDVFLDDLREKTHRGMAGQALKGYSCGSRVYGYRRVPIEDHAKKDEWGRPMIVAVKREKDEEQARWVKQIFHWYADGKSLRWIAGELNRLRVPTPGAQDQRKHPSKIAGLWFPRRLVGWSATYTGILENPLYIGRYVWNKREWLTDPETKRKSARLRPEHEWITTEHAVEPIIDDALWKRVQERLHSVRRTAEAPKRGRGPKYLLSGLLVCSTCHRHFVVQDTYRYGCPGHRVKGCTNGLHVARTLVEDKVLAGIRRDLFTEETVALFVQETTRLLTERQRAPHPDRKTVQQRLATVKQEIAHIMAVIKTGVWSPSLKAELEKAEAEQARLLAAPPPQAKMIDKLAAFLPNPHARYQTMLESMTTLAPKHLDAAREQIKTLVGEITLWPTAEGHLEAELTGNYAGLLKLAVGQSGNLGLNNGIYQFQ